MRDEEWERICGIDDLGCVEKGGFVFFGSEGEGIEMTREEETR